MCSLVLHVYIKHCVLSEYCSEVCRWCWDVRLRAGADPLKGPGGTRTRTGLDLRKLNKHWFTFTMTINH